MSNNIAEEIRKENEEEEAELFAAPPINKRPVNVAKYVWMFGVGLLDLATSFFVWQATILLYGVIWFLIGAAGLAYSEWQRERIGNNETQEKIGNAGVMVSALMVILGAIGMGAVYLLGLSNQRAVMLSVEAVTVLVFSFHLIQSYRYHNEDDEYKEQNKDARLGAKNVSKQRQILRAKTRVKNTESLEAQRQSARALNPEAFDAAYAFLMEERRITESKKDNKKVERNFDAGTDATKDFTQPAPKQ